VQFRKAFVIVPIFVLMFSVFAVLAEPTETLHMPDKPDGKIHCVTFVIDGVDYNFNFKKPVNRGDNLAIRAELQKIARKEVFYALDHGRNTIIPSRMLLAASTEQWSECGLSCVYAVARSGGHAYYCTCGAEGGGGVRVIVKNE
jgi:hypothetical protein